MTEFGALLHRLIDAGVEFIVVGGVAATAHGSARWDGRIPAGLQTQGGDAPERSSVTAGLIVQIPEDSLTTTS